jgi:hypothetical protein
LAALFERVDHVSIERLEDARHIMRGNAWPCIGDEEEQLRCFPYVNYAAM